MASGVSNTFDHILTTSQGGIGFMAFYIIMGGLVFSLVYMQHVFINRGLTTYEYLKNIWEDIQNPYNDGCCSNWKTFLKYSSGTRSLKRFVKVRSNKQFHRERGLSRQQSESQKFNQGRRKTRSLSQTNSMANSIRSNSIVEDMIRSNSIIDKEEILNIDSH